MVYRVYVEKKPGLDNEARSLLNDARDFLGVSSLERVRLLNRYDLENLPESLFLAPFDEETGKADMSRAIPVI